MACRVIDDTADIDNRDSTAGRDSTAS